MSTPLNPSETDTPGSPPPLPTNEQPTLPPSQQQPSPLLRLPPELRNIIYADALGGHTFSMSLRWVEKDHPIARADNAPPHAFALLRTNRQIYSEARLLPFTANTFTGCHAGHLREWVKTLSAEQRELIKAVKFMRRGYVLDTERGIEVNPTFWMDVPSVIGWGLEGLKRVEVEVTLLNWGMLKDEKHAGETKGSVMERMKSAVEWYSPPGVRVAVWRAG